MPDTKELRGRGTLQCIPSQDLVLHFNKHQKNAVNYGLMTIRRTCSSSCLTGSRSKNNILLRAI